MAGTRRRRELDAIRSSKDVGRLFRLLNGDERYEAPGWPRFVHALQTMVVGVMHGDPQFSQAGPPFVIDSTGFGADGRASASAMQCRLGLWEIARVHRGDLVRRCYCDRFVFGKQQSCCAACRVARCRVRRRTKPPRLPPGA